MNEIEKRIKDLIYEYKFKYLKSPESIILGREEYYRLCYFELHIPERVTNETLQTYLGLKVILSEKDQSYLNVE
jgi:hypothetical protein